MNLHGIFPPIATPFRDDEIDLDGMKRNVTRWMKTGLAGVLVLGSNGEAPMLDADESFRVASAVRECVPRDKTLIVGAGEESTRSTIAAVKRAAAGGRGPRARPHALLLQEPDDDRPVRPALHGRGRRVAGAGAAVQRPGTDGREDGGRGGGETRRRTRTSRA